jgi:hypothetical protein
MGIGQEQPKVISLRLQSDRRLLQYDAKHEAALILLERFVGSMAGRPEGKRLLRSDISKVFKILIQF